ncbi:hypothetical protein BV20DRAFT_817630 [Pilatotrama ljubarskyi]|nr:hypothetical protein BV20DRAFT_817630 [Pilatotrama ljubarskyi]
MGDRTLATWLSSARTHGEPDFSASRPPGHCIRRSQPPAVTHCCFALVGPGETEMTDEGENGEQHESGQQTIPLRTLLPRLERLQIMLDMSHCFASCAMYTAEALRGALTFTDKWTGRSIVLRDHVHSGRAGSVVEALRVCRQSSHTAG